MRPALVQRKDALEKDGKNWVALGTPSAWAAGRPLSLGQGDTANRLSQKQLKNFIAPRAALVP